MSTAFPTSGTGQDRQRKGFLRFARSSLAFGGEAAELHPEFTLIYTVFSPAFLFSKI
jgi:hypothetical protein